MILAHLKVPIWHLQCCLHLFLSKKSVAATLLREQKQEAGSEQRTLGNTASLLKLVLFPPPYDSLRSLARVSVVLSSLLCRLLFSLRGKLSGPTLKVVTQFAAISSTTPYTLHTPHQFVGRGPSQGRNPENRRERCARRPIRTSARRERETKRVWRLVPTPKHRT